MIFIVDFDGTISTKDTVDEALEAFGVDKEEIARIEDAWVQGRIGSKECLSEQFKQTRLTPDEFLNFARSVQIDPAFKDFYKAASKNHEVYIVSDGLDALIGEVFKLNGLSDVKFFANHVVWEKQSRISLQFPFSQATCAQQSGVCKCAVAQQQRGEDASKIVMIGDGRSDFCVAGMADMVFAKKSLKKHCVEKNIPHIAYETFAEINDYFGFPNSQPVQKPFERVA